MSDQLPSLTAVPVNFQVEQFESGIINGFAGIQQGLTPPVLRTAHSFAYFDEDGNEIAIALVRFVVNPTGGPRRSRKPRTTKPASDTSEDISI